jgi:hypothetical protein
MNIGTAVTFMLAFSKYLKAEATLSECEQRVFVQSEGQNVFSCGVSGDHGSVCGQASFSH